MSLVEQPRPKKGKLDVSRIAQQFIRNYAATNALPHAQEITADLEARIVSNVPTYGHRLQTGNGRDVLRDLDEEVLDAIHYAQQYVLEHPRLGKGHLVFYQLVQLAFDIRALRVAEANTNGVP